MNSGSKLLQLVSSSKRLPAQQTQSKPLPMMLPPKQQRKCCNLVMVKTEGPVLFPTLFGCRNKKTPPNHHLRFEITAQQTECIPSPPLLVKLQVLLGLCFSIYLPLSIASLVLQTLLETSGSLFTCAVLVICHK